MFGAVAFQNLADRYLGRITGPLWLVPFRPVARERAISDFTVACDKQTAGSLTTTPRPIVDNAVCGIGKFWALGITRKLWGLQIWTVLVGDRRVWSVCDWKLKHVQFAVPNELNRTGASVKPVEEAIHLITY